MLIIKLLLQRDILSKQHILFNLVCKAVIAKKCNLGYLSGGFHLKDSGIVLGDTARSFTLHGNG